MQGLELSRRYYREAVRPILEDVLPDLRHTAALVGPGSEVQGFDTEMSRDHDWGPRVYLFVDPEEVPTVRSPLERALEERLPDEFLGFSTTYLRSRDPEPTKPASVRLITIDDFFLEELGIDSDRTPSPAEWLSFPQQRLINVTAGEVFHDHLDLESIRERFAFYPHDVWLYQMASLWERIGEDEHLVGRAGALRDELGATVIAARLIRDMMRLALLIHRRYPPYAKWMGTALRRAPETTRLYDLLLAAIRAQGLEQRDQALSECYAAVAEMQNSIGVCAAQPTAPSRFFGRPFNVIELHARFASALRAEIGDPEVRAIAESQRLVGGIDVWSDSTVLLESVHTYAWARDLHVESKPQI